MKIRQNSQRESKILHYYYQNYWQGSSVFEAYKRPSIHKIAAEREILAEMNALSGWGYRVIGTNTFSFSCGYFFNVLIDGTAYKVFCYHSANSCRLFFNGEIPWNVFKQTPALYGYRRALLEFGSPAGLFVEYEKLKGETITKIEKDGIARRLQFVDDVVYQDSLSLSYINSLYSEITKGRKKIQEYRAALWNSAKAALELPANSYIPYYLFNIKGLQKYIEELDSYIEQKLDERRAQFEIEQAAEAEAWSQYMDAIL